MSYSDAIRLNCEMEEVGGVVPRASFPIWEVHRCPKFDGERTIILLHESS
jgi:hypothetical protein